MTRVIVLSDTHFPLQGSTLPGEIVKELKAAQYCIHAGDYVDPKVIDEIKKYTTFIGVKGNMDGKSIDLPQKKIVSIDGVNIGVVHGDGSPLNLLEYVDKQFSGDKKLDLIIFGHSHRAFNESRKGMIYFNPGSPTDTMYTKVNSYGILEIDADKKIRLKVVNV